MEPAMAQSSATGSVFGTVEAPAGSLINLTNLETGLKRSSDVATNGRYQVTALPPGRYKVELMRNNAVASTLEVEVFAGQGANASFGTMAAVQVTGRRNRIDVSNTNNGAVFSAKELAKLPVQANLTSIVLLAPNTTKADTAYGGASFGGGGASENAFYLNGFSITNPLTQLGSMELPFGAIQQASVITGGFGAEFGRSIGGVMNVTTKSGTNNWEAGAMYSAEPNRARASRRNIHYEKTGYVDNANTDGKLHYRRDLDEVHAFQYGAYMGGPLIKDKLFMFFAADQTITKQNGLPTLLSEGTAFTTTERDGWRSRRSLESRWVGKIDFNITDNHRVEFTSAGDDWRERVQRYGFTLAGSDKAAAQAALNGAPNNTLYSSLVTRNPGPTGINPGPPGAKVNMLKYIGNLTDDLTLTALFGRLKSERGVTYEHGFGGAQVPPSVTVPAVANRVPELDAQGLYKSFNPFTGNLSKPGSDEVKSFRLDLEYKWGDHTIRGGLDSHDIDITSAGLATSGGSAWSYRKVAAGRECLPTNLSNARPAIVCNFGGFGTRGYYARQRVFSSITDAKAEQTAQYIEDRWQFNKNLLLTFGLRNEQYSNTTGDGDKFIDVKDQIAPRLSASWDVNGDASLKVFGSMGRYHLQLPGQVAARAASRSTLTDQDFTYTGIDPNTGVPTGLTPINVAQSPDGETGSRKPPQSVVVKDLKPNYQDELTLGFEKAWSPDLNFGLKGTYRKLGAGIDDSCDTRILYDFALKNGIPVVSKDYMNCFIFNPGKDVTIWVDGHDAAGNPIVSGKGKYANFSAAEIGSPKAKREYTALDMFLEHPLRNGWYGRINYTLSRSKGNMEGQTRSDTGQTDVGTSAGWDYPEFAANSEGLLPNDRKHQLKLFGFYQLTPEISVGGNALIQSGRPKTCLGTNEAAENGELFPPLSEEYGGPGYGAEYFWCGGKPAPRGSLGRLPTERRLDLSMTYAPNYMKGLAFKMDVFNVFNSQKVTARRETYDDGSGHGILANYGEARSLQDARSVKFTVEYNHKF
ncbi:TonB-dependent receptor [Pseudoduganella sp. DS3]|uniref:TonB-dependent receptor n=1 Tax=Pseudoduganella guangdongensis TaxID=2692179 RepID=A0A6N9HF74_9BURK|nr:TonB-dependent receptor [Pseudoduganella guangdongensis]MYN01485.1 TonB-dependent receptor [Pseudoduganella guangdongensis]